MTEGLFAGLRRSWRGSSWQHDIRTAVIIFAFLLALGGWLQRVWLNSGHQYSSSSGDNPGNFLQRWMVAELIASAILLPIVAALLGALVQPDRQEAEEVRATLLTRMRPIEILGSRLLVKLRPIWLLLILSTLLWSAVQLGWKALPDAGWMAVCQANLAIACAVLGTAGSSLLFSSRSSPGRSVVRGAVLVTLLHLSSCLLVLIVNPIMARQNNPINLIQDTLLINPVAAISTPLKLDLLRTKWVYDHSVAPDYSFRYPRWWISALLFLGMGIFSTGIASWRLNKVYLR